MIWCVERERNNSFEVAIRTSFFDDDAESLGKKRLVVDGMTKFDLRLSCRSLRFGLHKISLFLPTLFVAPPDLRLPADRKV